MSETQLLRFQERKLRVLEDTTAALETSHNGEVFTLLDELIYDCLQLETEMERVWQHLRRSITSGAEVDYQATGDLLRVLFARVVRVLRSVHSLGKKAVANTGRVTPGLDELVATAERMKALETRLLSAWPWPDDPFPAFDPDRLASAREGASRGEGENVNDLLVRLEKGGTIGTEG